ncbi:MAG: pilus assembly protein [Kiritimatiellae bacterium]|nr:pilus assembly protein [Kiritimatiellia bacterium]
MRTSRRGQAAIEFAIGVFVFALIVTALVGFAPVYLKNMELQSEARCDAGMSALESEEGADDLGNAAAFTSYAHPPPVAEGVDPWTYPIDNMPDEFRFGDWRGNGVSAGRLIQGGRKKDFRFRMFSGGAMLVDDKGTLSETLYLPAMGGLKTVGGN